ncbi:EAL domain-containing protein [Neptuniibacter sp. QD37_11]|uniref:EAL domain-containing protein n=1 Tax=Neptuniibacter sp. QD37_11 TaxID=3398209 RepID=UPI0039F46159
MNIINSSSIFNRLSGDRKILPLEVIVAFSLVLMCISYLVYAIYSYKDATNDAVDEMKETQSVMVQTTHAIYQHHHSILTTIGQHLVNLGAVDEPAKGAKYLRTIHALNPGFIDLMLIKPNGRISMSSKQEKQKMSATITLPPNMLKNKNTKLEMLRPVYDEAHHQWNIPVIVPIHDKSPYVEAYMLATYRLTGSATTWDSFINARKVRYGLLRNDGHWQYLSGLTDIANTQKYRMPEKLYIQKEIEESAHRKVEEARYLPVSMEGRESLMLSRYIPEYGFYTVTFYKSEDIFLVWFGRQKIPLVLGMLFFAGSILSLNIARFLQDKSDRARQAVEAQLYDRAHFNPLTELPNRTYAIELIEHEFEFASVRNLPVSLGFIDIDNFKNINDSFGHDAGDLLIKKVSQLISRLAGDNNHIHVCHLSGDEFCVIWGGGSQEEMREFIKVFSNTNPAKFKINDHSFYISASMGVATYPYDDNSPMGLLKCADIALNASKKKGKKQVLFYNSELASKRQRWIEIEHELRDAIKNEELSVFYQSKYQMGIPEAPVGFEALVRWNSLKLGFVSPAEFIPVAESCGMIGEIGDYVLTRACRDAVKLREQFNDNVSVAVNASMYQLRHKSFIGDIKRNLEINRLPASVLEIEVTETMLAKNYELILSNLQGIKELGVAISIDDFGTGYSSLSYLSNFPFNCVKIDRGFTQSCPGSDENEAIIRAIVTLAHTLGMEVVAEGVETRIQEDFLKDIDVDIVQGFLYSKPKSLEVLSTDKVTLF